MAPSREILEKLERKRLDRILQERQEIDKATVRRLVDAARVRVNADPDDMVSAQELASYSIPRDNHLNNRTSLAEGREEKVAKQVVGLAKDLAEAVMRTSFAEVDSASSNDMKRIAATILGILGVEMKGKTVAGRIFAADLVVGGIYTAKGWVAEGEFDWTFLGMADDHIMNVRREGQEPTSELLANHGLAPYNDDGIWHPTNWTEGTGLSEEMVQKAVSDIHLRTDEALAIPEEDNEF